ncbi:hypothetical protein [Actinomadura bangladeshensis]|uniref:Uncharacterized protein n=1 Tax=Actinomadura bangladeshensis TaxID=453573 RepID=A0A6L9Q9W3_9ACTN|nr:hypothetical protein [Actinomadura bangladeshensis]NEA22191.1 hypothetical protein [Actinomadura bangladeshensis]
MGTRDRELVLLGELVIALAKLGVDVKLRDAIPGATFRATRADGRQVYGYVVLKGGTHFTWWQVDHTHPATDVQGAARRILESLQSAPGQSAKP